MDSFQEALMPGEKPYNFNCEKCFALLGSFIDRELSSEEIAEVQLHLDHCPPCAKFFKFEGSVMKHIGEKLKECKQPAGLFEKLCKGLPDD